MRNNSASMPREAWPRQDLQISVEQLLKPLNGRYRCYRKVILKLRIESRDQVEERSQGFRWASCGNDPRSVECDCPVYAASLAMRKDSLHHGFARLVRLEN